MWKNANPVANIQLQLCSLKWCFPKKARKFIELKKSDSTYEIKDKPY